MAWIDASPGQLGEPLHIGVVGESESLSWVGDEIRHRIAAIEGAFELTIEVHKFTRADVPEVEWGEVTLLAGIPPTGVESTGRRASTHTDRDERALRMSQAIAQLLNHDPSLAKRAMRHVERMLEDEPGSASHDLREWRAILSRYSQERLLAFLVSATSRALRLRQSSPFFAVLSSDERDEVLQALERGP